MLATSSVRLLLQACFFSGFTRLRILVRLRGILLVVRVLVVRARLERRLVEVYCECGCELLGYAGNMAQMVGSCCDGDNVGLASVRPRGGSSELRLQECRLGEGGECTRERVQHCGEPAVDVPGKIAGVRERRQLRLVVAGVLVGRQLVGRQRFAVPGVAEEPRGDVIEVPHGEGDGRRKMTLHGDGALAVRWLRRHSVQTLELRCAVLEASGSRR